MTLRKICCADQKNCKYRYCNIFLLIKIFGFILSWGKDKVYYSLLRKSRQRKIIIVLLCVHVSVSADEALGRGDIRAGRVTVLNSVYTTFRYWVEQYFHVNQSMTQTTYPREYLNGFLRTKPTRPSYDLAPPPPPSPLSRQQVVSHSQASFLPPVELTDGRGGREGEGLGAKQIIRRRESQVLYKSLNTL